MKKLIVILIIFLVSIFNSYGQVNMNFILIINDTLQYDFDVNINVEIIYKNGTRIKYKANYIPGDLTIKEMKDEDLKNIEKIRFYIEKRQLNTYELETRNRVIQTEGSSYFFKLRYVVLYFYDLKYYKYYVQKDPNKDYVWKISYPTLHGILLRKDGIIQ